MSTSSFRSRPAGGHSSLPPPHTAIGILGRAVARLEDHPYPARVDGVAGQTLRGLGPEMPYPGRLAVANLWLFGPLVARALAVRRRRPTP